MYKDNPGQRLEPSGEVKTGDVEQHPMGMQGGVETHLSQKVTWGGGAGREGGAGDCTPIFQGKAEEQRGQEIKEERWPGTREPRRVWNVQSEHGACGDRPKKGLCRGRDLKALGYINASPLGP